MEVCYTLRDLVELSQKIPLRVPYYQRGYIWGKRRNDDEIKDSVHYLLKDLVRVVDNEPIFVQGITTTLTEPEDEKPLEFIDIIDGQQRITTIYLLLKVLGFNKLILTYESRTDSTDFLDHIALDEEFLSDNANDSQDIHYFKNALRICKDEYAEILREHIGDLLNNVQFLWIKIPRDKAQVTFTMMNGQRAKMTVPELIKAELLRRASLDGQNGTSSWECHELRGRYARTWDEWVRWWSDENKSRKWLHLSTSDPLSILILLVYNTMSNSSRLKMSDNLTFDKFLSKVFGHNNDSKRAKEVFYQMRGIQNRIEDAFEDPITYNLIGGITYMFSRHDRNGLENFLLDYFSESGIVLDDTNCFKESSSNFKDKSLEIVYKKSFLGLTYNEIKNSNIKENENQFYNKLTYTKQLLFRTTDLYRENEAKEKGFEYLIRRNIDEDCKQNGEEGRKFDFTILSERSLEHIYPKSKVWHVDGSQLLDGNNSKISSTDGMLNRQEIEPFNDGVAGGVALSEHSLGNLVLLYKSNNSEFSNSDPKGKKKMLFDPNCKEFFRSRNLLHTIMIFAKNECWDASHILANHKAYFEEFNKFYELK